jgi:2-polyprenyl-3-methyl-5-hydroxy-6-metoxy-1,4-benzoquinol methylase
MGSESMTIQSRPQAHCMLCGSEGRLLYANLPDRLFSAPGQWNLSRCRNAACRLIWLDPMPIEEDIWKAYQTYYTHERRAVPVLERLLAWMLYGFLGLLRERRRSDGVYLDGLAPGRVLEIGFGDGNRMERLTALGWQVEGQEVDAVSVANARKRGLEVHEGSLKSCRLADASYDAIIGSHVIEHVHDPEEMIRECVRLLKPGGTLVLYTPNADSYGHRVFGEHWRGLEPPRHLQLFDPGNMATLVQHAGFREYRVRTSHAKAGTTLRGSIDLKRSGQHTMGRSPRVRIAAEEMVHVGLARFQQIMGAQNGEELIVTAIR